ncbi:MAG: DNA gyrase subunit A, partial [Myxococcota bacterium]|nr:DNA gyrase subunit A [Myxococcota bacterium]
MTTSPNIIPVDIESEIEQAYLDYAMSVIIGRALPDVRDGLKPVHRRILYAQHELGNRYNSSYKKSARIVGDVIGKYHPHGDSAVYDALVRMAQDFNMRVPLVDGQGNFGSVDGDPAAAMRYTEVRMSRVTQELLGDLDKDTVDWGPNYDGTLNEPIVLPATVPNLLVNGSSGIAVGMSTNIPPHNLTEVIDATIGLIENPEMEFEELMGYIPGPDFPTGGEIYGAAGIREAYETGRGIIRIRARADIEVDDRTGKPRIIVYELPFQVNKARLIEKIADLVRDKKIDGITDLRDESDRKGMRIVIELRRDVVPEVILNNLFKMTSMQSSFGIIMLAIVHGQPKIMALKEVLNHFIDFRRDVTTRRTIYELDQAEARAHILEGLKIALDHIDEVIDLIRSSADGQAAREGLMATFGLSERQTQAILDMRLQKLTGLERDKILEELEVVRAEIDRLREILSDEGKLLEVIRGELENVRDTYGDERRTTINYSTSNLSIEDLIAEEQMVVTITHAGYIKRTPLTEYQAQRRGGRGKRGMATKDEDFVEDMFVASTHSHVLFFTSIGKVYKLKVHELPLGSRTTKGKAIINILPIEDGETVKAILPIDEFEEGRYILTATRKGVVKKTDLMAYSRVLSVGIIALSLKEDDELVAVRTTSGDDSVFLTSFNGQGILFSEEDVRPMGRTAAGVFGMRFRDDDELVSMTVIPKELMDRVQNGEEVSDRLVAVTEHGYGKRTEIGEFSVQGRGGLGVITIK